MAKWMTHPKGGVLKIEHSMQEESCKAAGWTYCEGPSPVVVVESVPQPSEPEVVPHSYGERLYLEERAHRLGIKGDRRWGLERLKREIEDNEEI